MSLVGMGNRLDLIEVFKMCNGLSRIRLSELFTLDDNIKGTRGHTWKLAKFTEFTDASMSPKMMLA